jgi:serine/threonine-protein kinase
MDFGIAKQLDPVGQASLTRTGHALGSPEYMSPEQIRSSKHVDARSDVFSAGVVLYELLCGKLPWDTNRPLSDVMVAICTEDAPRLRQHAGWIEPALEGVVMRALARDPADRWQSVRDLADALAPFAGGSDVIRPEDLQPPDDTSRFAAVLKSGPHVKSDATTVGALEIREVTDPLIGRVLGGLYRLKRVIGRGGMGSVYEADPPDGKSVAIKLISTEVAGDDDQTVRRFLREAQAAKLVESPHVTRTLELSLDSELGAPFLVMELLTGIDLAALVKERAPLEPEPVVRLFIQAARGLAAAHAKGVVHRDIKPANFFLHEAAPGAGVTVKVCDFGIAKRVDAVSREQSSRDLTRTGGILGSPVYMSPEQAKNAKNVDHRSDIWSLCVSLYEALSGRQLWQEYTSFGEIIVAICTEPVPPLRDHAPWLDEALARVVHRGLERDVKQRWQSADELIAALEPFSGGRVDFTLAELTTIDPIRRATAPRRVVLASDPGLVDSTTLHQQATVAVSIGPDASVGTARRRTTRRSALVALGAVAIVLLGIGGVLSMVPARQTKMNAAPTSEVERSLGTPAGPSVAPSLGSEALVAPSSSLSAGSPSASSPAPSRSAAIASPASGTAPAKPKGAPSASAKSKPEPAPATTNPAGAMKPKEDWQ